MTRTIISPSIFYLCALIVVSSPMAAVALSAVPFLQIVLMAFAAGGVVYESISDLGQLLCKARCYRAAENVMRFFLYFRKLDTYTPGKYWTQLYLAERGILEYALCEQQKYLPALAVNKQNLKLAREKFGTTSCQYIDELVNRSYILGSMGSPDAEVFALEAVELLNGLTLRSKTETEALGAALNNLAAIMINSGNTERGLQLFDKAFALKRAFLKPDDPSLTASYANYGYALIQAKQYAEAEKQLNHALSMADKPGVSAELEATIRNNLGDALIGLGRLDEAESQLLLSLKKRQQIHTKTHPFMAYSYHNLAKLRREQGNLAESEDYFKKAIAIRERIPGTNNIDLNETLTQFRQLLKKQDRLHEAEAIAEAHGLSKDS